MQKTSDRSLEGYRQVKPWNTRRMITKLYYSPPAADAVNEKNQPLPPPVIAPRTICNAGEQPVGCGDGAAEALASRIPAEVSLRAGLVLVPGNVERRIKQQCIRR